MKRTIIIIVTILSSCFISPAQGTGGMKPKIMVVPEKAWAINNGYSDASGKGVDYSRVLRNENILNAITEMGNIMAERGYPLEHIQQQIDKLNNEEALDIALTSKHDGELMEDDLDKLIRTAQADILVNIAFSEKRYGPQNRMEFRITSIDAATGKQIGGNVGASPSSSGSSTATLLKASVVSFMDDFCSEISNYFADVVEKGREGTFIFKIAEDCPLNFQSDVYLNGEEGELSEVIEYWINENCLGAFTQSGRTKIRLAYDQVRFPLIGKGKFGGKAKAIDAEGFIKPIGSFLSQFGISIVTTPIGIGEVVVVLGSK